MTTATATAEPFAALLDSAKISGKPIDTHALTAEPAPDEGAGRDAHHDFGPSRWPALLACRHFKSKPPTADTQRGTELHAALERFCKGELFPPADYLEANVLSAFTSLVKSTRIVELWSEHRVKIPAPAGTSDLGIFGRLDVAWIDGENWNLHVADLKMCENPDRDYRPQLIAYAIGLMEELNGTQYEGHISRIVLHMLYADNGHYTSELLPVEAAKMEYGANYSGIATIASINNGPFGLLDATQCGWCDLCANYTACPAARAVAETVNGTLADAPERWAEFSSARKAQLCALAEAVAKWAAAIKAQASDDAKGGEAIEDPDHGIFYEVRERAGKLYLDTEEAWAVVRQFVSPEEFKRCCDVAQTRLVDALKATGMKPKDAKALLEAAGTRAAPTLMFVRKGVRA